MFHENFLKSESLCPDRSYWLLARQYLLLACQSRLWFSLSSASLSLFYLLSTGTCSSGELGQIVWDTGGAHSHSGCASLCVLFYLSVRNSKVLQGWFLIATFTWVQSNLWRMSFHFLKWKPAMQKDHVQGRSSGCLEIAHWLVFLVYSELKKYNDWDNPVRKQWILKGIFSIRVWDLFKF